MENKISFLIEHYTHYLKEFQNLLSDIESDLDDNLSNEFLIRMQAKYSGKIEEIQQFLKFLIN